MGLWTKAFWLSLAERAVKTLAQSLVAVLTVSATGLLDVDWLGAISTAGLATLISVLTSIGSNAITKTGPSVTSSELVADPELIVARKGQADDVM